MSAIKIRECLSIFKRSLSQYKKVFNQSNLLKTRGVLSTEQAQCMHTTSCAEVWRTGSTKRWCQRRKEWHVLGVAGTRLVRSMATNPTEIKPTKLLTGRLKKKSDSQLSQKLKDGINAAAYVVGDSINFHKLRAEIKHGELYEEVQLPDDIKNAIMVTALYRLDEKDRDAFIFNDGRVACWNMTEGERLGMLDTVLGSTNQPLKMDIILDEEELQPVVYDRVTGFAKNKIHIKKSVAGEEFDETLALQKYTFSDAMGHSVILSMCERKLDAFTDKIEPEMLKFRDGTSSKVNITDVNKNRGEVFLLRHEINLESDLLDYPDLYWEREDLEGLYKTMVDYYNIELRIMVFNNRIGYCSDFLELLANQHNDAKHVFLEKVIIILILIEVIFGGVPFLEQYFSWVLELGIEDSDNGNNGDSDSVEN